MPQDGKVWPAYMYAHMPIDLQPANQTVRVTLNFLHCRGNKAVWSQRNSTDSLSIALCAHTTLSGRGDFWHNADLCRLRWEGGFPCFIAYTNVRKMALAQICCEICGAGGQVKPSNWFRRIEKLVLPFTFLTQVFRPWWCETCRVIIQQPWHAVV